MCLLPNLKMPPVRKLPSSDSKVVRVLFHFSLSWALPQIPGEAAGLCESCACQSRTVWRPCSNGQSGSAARNVVRAARPAPGTTWLQECAVNGRATGRGPAGGGAAPPFVLRLRKESSAWGSTGHPARETPQGNCLGLLPPSELGSHGVAPPRGSRPRQAPSLSWEQGTFSPGLRPQNPVTFCPRCSRGVW